MNEGIIERIDQLIRETETEPIRDAALIITANGVGAAARLTAIKECKNIVIRANHE